MNIQELCDRYSLSSKKSLYSRREALGIEFLKDEEGKSYADEQMVKLFDDLDAHLANGGTLKNYSPVVATTQIETLSGQEITPSVVTTTHPVVSTTEEALLRVIDQLLEQVSPRDPITYNESLEKAAANHWILSTNEVFQLIGVKPKGEKFSRGSWQFIRQGKIGHQAGWKVVKSN